MPVTTDCQPLCQPNPRRKRDFAERFWEKVQKTDGCWLWTAAIGNCGYGSFQIDRRTTRRANRVAWELTNGLIPAGMFVCHSCDNPACVNPAHLWIGSHADNMRDRREKGRYRFNRPKGDRCRRGHKFSYDNGSQQICLECRKLYSKSRKCGGTDDL